MLWERFKATAPNFRPVSLGGTVSVITGSRVVTGSGTAFLSGIGEGDFFEIIGDESGYPVLAVNSDSELVLMLPYSGPTRSGLQYLAFGRKWSACARKFTNREDVLLPTAIDMPYIPRILGVDVLAEGITTPINGVISQIASGTDTLTTPPDSIWPGGIPDQTFVSQAVTGHRGAHSAAFHNVLNPTLTLTPCDHGTVNTNGTAVTWVSSELHPDGSHPQFRDDWTRGFITINGAPYKIRSVEDATHLTLTSSAGVQTGVPYSSGVGGIACEIDVNQSEDLHQGTGLIVASGGTKHPDIGIAINTAFTTEATWNTALAVGGYRYNGILVSKPSDPNGRGLYIENGATGGSEIKYGGGPASAVLTLSGASQNLLVFRPADDTDGAVVYCSNSAGDQVNWSISKGGMALFPLRVATDSLTSSDVSSPLNIYSPLVLSYQSSNLLRITPSDDTAGVVMYGTNAANSQVNWSISKDGMALFPQRVVTNSLTSSDVTSPLNIYSPLILSYQSNNLLRITPSDDAPGTVLYGTDAANNQINWSVSKDGSAEFKNLHATGVTVTGQTVLGGAAGDLLRVTPSDDSGGAAMYGTNAANNSVKWVVFKDGSTYFKTLQLSGVPVFVDNAAAVAGGLTSGMVYRTPVGALMITF